MQDSEVDGEVGRLRAEAVAMLSEQAALCSTPEPAPAALLEPAPPARVPARAAVPEPLPLPAADTAALLRELRSLGEDPPLPVAPAAAPTAPVSSAPVVRVRRGVFRRRP